MMARARSLAVLAALCLVASACDEKARVTITEPAIGAMLPGGEDVTVRGKCESKNVVVNGETVSAGGSFETVIPEVDGLGFVAANIPDDPLIAVRSWHQGSYLPSGETHHSTIAVGVGSEALDGAGTTFASLVEDLLEGEELAGFVDNPLTMTVTILVPVNVTVNVTSVTSADIDIALSVDSGVVGFVATLAATQVDYTATAVSLSSSGTAVYESIEISGSVDLTTEGASLAGVLVSASDPVITDSGGLPPAGVTSLAHLLRNEVPPAIEEAAAEAADMVFRTIIEQVKPEVGLEFEQPITQQSVLESVTVFGPTIGLAYGTLVKAQTPQAASAGQAVLERHDPCIATASGGLDSVVGSALVNQMAFAVWDAGNLSGIVFTRDELEEAGMEPLEFPYDRLDEVAISLLLPPLLEWGDDGPQFAIGEIRVEISVEGTGDTTAWTAASVPVVLEIEGDDLRIRPDPSRPITIREVGFASMNSLADTDQVLSILETAVPGVVSRVFGDLPAITMPSIGLERLDGTAGPVVAPVPTGVTMVSGCFRIGLALTDG